MGGGKPKARSEHQRTEGATSKGALATERGAGRNDRSATEERRDEGGSRRRGTRRAPEGKSARAARARSGVPRGAPKGDAGRQGECSGTLLRTDVLDEHHAKVGLIGQSLSRGEGAQITDEVIG